jgi:hypothetical protein
MRGCILHKVTPRLFGFVQHFIFRQNLDPEIETHDLRPLYHVAYSLGIERLERQLLAQLDMTVETQAFLRNACSPSPPQDQLEKLIDVNFRLKGLDFRITRCLDVGRTEPSRLAALWRRTPACRTILFDKTLDIACLDCLPPDWKEKFSAWAHGRLRLTATSLAASAGQSFDANGIVSVRRPGHPKKSHPIDPITGEGIRETAVAVGEIRTEWAGTGDIDGHIGKTIPSAKRRFLCGGIDMPPAKRQCLPTGSGLSCFRVSRIREPPASDSEPVCNDPKDTRTAREQAALYANGPRDKHVGSGRRSRKHPRHYSKAGL